MKIKTGRRIEIECQNSDKKWEKKWIAVDDFIKILEHIKKVNNNKCTLVQVAIDTQIILLKTSGADEKQ